MTGHGTFLIKCEPTSEEDDGETQCSQIYQSIKTLSSDLGPLVQSSESTNHVPEHLLQQLQRGSSLEELVPAPAGPAATPVSVKHEPLTSACALETLEPAAHHNVPGATLLDRHQSLLNEMPDSSEFMPLISIKDEPLSEGEQINHSGDDTSDSSPAEAPRGSPKSWTQRDMENALDALRNHNMSLTKASATFGIPSTTLWQRAHRLGIDTPKKEGSSKSWSEADLRLALHALRAGAISANKASKAYGIPSSTLYKIARREGIRLSAPFNAAPTAWGRADLTRALHAIRAGHASVQSAAQQYGIPTGTLYGRCKREGIELSRSNPTPWSEDAMGEALEAVRVGQMSINQAAIHYNLPYSSLYGRFKRCRYQTTNLTTMQQDQTHPEMENQNLQELHPYYHQMPSNVQQMPEQAPSNEEPSSLHEDFQHSFIYHQMAGQDMMDMDISNMYYASCNMAS